jgi:hypothetical protein
MLACVYAKKMGRISVTCEPIAVFFAGLKTPPSKHTDEQIDRSCMVRFSPYKLASPESIVPQNPHERSTTYKLK